jgi:small-conductance mechanosensitive channel
MRGPLQLRVKAPKIVSFFHSTLRQEWLTTIIAIVVAFVVWRLLEAVITRFYARRFVSRLLPRVSTYAGVTRSVTGLVIFVVALLVVLDIWHLDVAPALWSAGVVGIVIGVGAQAIVRDVLTGMFYLFEDTFDVGDGVELTTGNGVVRGVVDAVSLRETRIIDERGYVVSIPHGSIVYAANSTRLPLRLSIDFTVPLRTDVGTLRAQLTQIAEQAIAQCGVDIDGLNVVLADIGPNGATFRIHFQTKRKEAHVAPPRLRELVAAELQSQGLLSSSGAPNTATPAQT